MLLHNHLDMIGRNEPIQRKAKFWQSYIRALKGTDDMRAPEQSHYSRYPSRRPLLSDIPSWPNVKSIYDDPINASDRITVPGYRYLPISRETYGISPRNIYPHHYTSLDRYPRHGGRVYSRGAFPRGTLRPFVNSDTYIPPTNLDTHDAWWYRNATAEPFVAPYHPTSSTRYILRDVTKVPEFAPVSKSYLWLHKPIRPFSEYRNIWSYKPMLGNMWAYRPMYRNMWAYRPWVRPFSESIFYD